MTRQPTAAIAAPSKIVDHVEHRHRGAEYMNNQWMAANDSSFGIGVVNPANLLNMATIGAALKLALIMLAMLYHGSIWPQDKTYPFLVGDSVDPYANIPWLPNCEQAGGTYECKRGSPGEILWFYGGTPYSSDFPLPECGGAIGCATAQEVAENIKSYSLSLPQLFPMDAYLCDIQLIGLNPNFDAPGALYRTANEQRGSYNAIGIYGDPWGQCKSTYTGSSSGGFLIKAKTKVSCEPGWVASAFGCQRPPVNCCIRPGNPIDVGTGAKVQTETDIPVSDGWGLGFQRFYNSQGSTGPGSTSLSSAFGGIWGHSYQRSVIMNTYGTHKTISVVSDDGRKIVFQPGSGGGWVPPPHRPERLVQLQIGSVFSGWRFFAPNSSIETYDTNGKLLSVHAVNGERTNISYTDGTASALSGSVAVDTGLPMPAGLLRTITDGFGKYITIYYLENKRIAKISTSSSNSVSFNFDNILRLKNITHGDGKTKQYIYYTEDSLVPLASSEFLLVGIVDENGIRHSTYTYDSHKRAVATELAGGVNKYTVNYPWADALTGGSVTLSITDPLLGGNQLETMWLVNGFYRKGTSTRPAGAGSASASSSLAYDANGNVASTDDFNGARTCYANDLGRNLETARIEGLANTIACNTVTLTAASLPAGSRKTSTQWHPDWRLAIRIAEPGKITTNVYNGQPDPFNGNAIASCAPASALLPDGHPIAVLCKQVEQSTTDPDGHLGFAAPLQTSVPNRQSSWTYNSFGQILTAQGPRTDITDLTTYSYYTDTTSDHTLGDLRSVTNSQGKTTQYPLYNKHGQVLRAIDSNGAVTDNTYDLRQRLLSTTVGGLKTSYVYDAAGQLKKVTLPDATTLTYTYDAAHRLVQETDAQGRTTSYTLDNAGNRVQEQLKNPSGGIIRNVTRVFDALGRLQSVTGAPE